MLPFKHNHIFAIILREKNEGFNFLITIAYYRPFQNKSKGLECNHIDIMMDINRFRFLK